MSRRQTPFATALILSLLAAAAVPSFAANDKPEKKQKLISIVFLLKSPRKIDVYNLIGKLMADLAGDDVLALYAPETGKMIWYDNKVREKLRSQNSLSAFDWDDPLIGIDDDDPRMKAAVKKARDSFNDFATAFAARKPGQPFVIKAPFGKGEDTEYMWVEVESIEKDLIKGALANHPIKVKNLKERDQVEVKRSDLTDWAYNDGKPHGMFTESLLRENEEKPRK